MLITCKECNGKVSENAASCPKCGNPITPELVADAKQEAKVTKGLSIALLAALGISIAYCTVSTDNEPTLQPSQSERANSQSEQAHTLQPDQNYAKSALPGIINRFEPISELSFIGLRPLEVSHCTEYLLDVEATGWNMNPYRHHEYFTDGPNGGAVYIEIEDETSQGWLLVDLIVYRTGKGSRADVYQMWSEGSRPIPASEGIYPKLQNILEQCTPDKNWAALNR